MAGGACKKNTETFTEEPFSIYVRVYLKRQGRWQQVNIIAHDVHMQAAFCEFPTDPPSPVIAVTWAVLNAQFERTIRYVILFDHTPPLLAARGRPAIDVKQGLGVQLTLDAQDTGGIHRQPILDSTRGSASQSLLMPLKETVTEDRESVIGLTRGLYQVTLPLAQVAGARVRLEPSTSVEIMDSWKGSSTLRATFRSQPVLP